MTSQEISEIRYGSPSAHSDRGVMWWLQEIAYQLAVMNEARTIWENRLPSAPEAPKVSESPVSLLCSVEGCERWRQYRFCGIWICDEHRQEISITGIYPPPPAAGLSNSSTEPETGMPPKESQSSG